jgi:hypothetical protein
MVIGSWDRFEAPFPPAECGRRLNRDRSADSYVGHADESGFQLAVYGRTGVQIRGTFRPSGAGSEVVYRAEFTPWVVWALVLAFAACVPAIIALVWSGYLPGSMVALLIAIVPLALAANLWISERQARGLRAYVASVLGPTDR